MRPDLLLVLIGFDGVVAEYHDDPETVRVSSVRTSSRYDAAQSSHLSYIR